MKNKSIILSRTATAFICGGLIFTGFTVLFFIRSSIIWGITSAACALLFLISSLFVPITYVVDRESIRLRYVTGDKEIYPWKKVRAINAEYDLTVPYVYDAYVIDGEDETTHRFYKEGRLERSSRAARLIQAYSGMTVNGLIPDGIKGSGAVRRYKMSFGKRPECEAAKVAERKARKTVREATTLLGGKAEGLTLQYSFVTPDGESEKRPAVGYSYVLSVGREGKMLGEKITLAVIKRKGNRLIEDASRSIDADRLAEEIGRMLG